MTKPSHKSPVLAACLACEHVWPTAWIPAEVSTVAQSIMAHSKVCPACGHKSSKTKPIVMARKEQCDAWQERHPNMATEVKHND